MLIQTRPIPARDDADDDGRDGTGPSPLIVSILARTQLSSGGSVPSQHCGPSVRAG